jgi:hypothetical protein
MSADQDRPIYVAILGTDAVLAARPVDPVQLTRACQLAGFDFVVPVSWGEELIAAHLAARIGASTRAGSMVAAVCPLTAEHLSGSGMETPIVSTVSPPVATARYIRAAFQPRPLHVTYVGACPGATHAEIDVHCLPEALFTRLTESGIDASRQPRHLDGHIPAERARYASAPGGMPDSNWLLAHTGHRVVEAAPITADVVAQLYRDESVLIDLATSCRCVCAGNRIMVTRLEPPRSPTPVVGSDAVPMTNGRLAETVELPPDEHEADDDRRARFSENGLSSDDVVPITPLEHTLTKSVEPW